MSIISKEASVAWPHMAVAWRKCGHPRTPGNTTPPCKPVRSGQCKICTRVAQVRHVGTAKHRITSQRYLASSKGVALKLRTRMKSWGLSTEFYVDRLAEQKGTCAGCGVSPKRERLHVDHQHSLDCSRERQTCRCPVRGLLCRSCNTRLALAKDNPKTLWLASGLQTYLMERNK